MPKHSPAPTGARITAADVEAAERAEVVAASLRLQQAMTAGPPPPSPDSDTAKVLAALDRLERRPTSDELASQQEQARLADIARRNAEGADASRAYAARLAASGYQGWTGGGR